VLSSPEFFVATGNTAASAGSGRITNSSFQADFHHDAGRSPCMANAIRGSPWTPSKKAELAILAQLMGAADIAVSPPSSPDAPPSF
jgi:hypothetical protein